MLNKFRVDIFLKNSFELFYRDSIKIINVFYKFV